MTLRRDYNSCRVDQLFSEIVGMDAQEALENLNARRKMASQMNSNCLVEQKAPDLWSEGLRLAELRKIVHNRNMAELRRIDPKAKTIDGVLLTILHLCASCVWLEGIQYLLSHGADITIEDKDDDVAFLCLCMESETPPGNRIAAAKLFVQYGQDVNVLDWFGHNILTLAVMNNNPAFVKFLLAETNINISQRARRSMGSTRKGETALDFAKSLTGREEIIAALEQHAYDTLAQNSESLRLHKIPGNNRRRTAAQNSKPPRAVKSEVSAYFEGIVERLCWAFFCKFMIQEALNELII